MALSEIKHGTRSTYVTHRCSCDECRKAVNEYNSLSRTRFAERPPEEIQHGYGAYTWGCRCDVCKQAKADYMRERRAAARKKAGQLTDSSGYHFVPGIKHGRFGYDERGCRCPECRTARAESDKSTTASRASRAAA